MNQFRIYRDGVTVTDPRVGTIFIATDEGGEMGTPMNQVLDILANELPDATVVPSRVAVAGLPASTRVYLTGWGFLSDRGWEMTLLSQAGTNAPNDGSHVGFVNAEGEVVMYATAILVMHRPVRV